MATTERKTTAREARAAKPKALKDLRQDPRNARQHTERNLAMISDSLELVGAGRSLVIDEDATILAGNATQRQALARGMKLRVVDADRDTIVAVRRRDLTPEQKAQLAVFDNRAAELAGWNAEILRDVLPTAGDAARFWTPAELHALLQEDEPEPAGDAGPVKVGQCGVIVLCENETEQERVYSALIAEGYTCRVVNT